jgi:hypothetical protein
VVVVDLVSTVETMSFQLQYWTMLRTVVQETRVKGGVDDERGMLMGGGKWKTNECTTNDGPRIVVVSAVIHD